MTNDELIEAYKKDPKNKKVVSLNPNLQIQTEGNIFLDYKFLGR